MVLRSLLLLLFTMMTGHLVFGQGIQVRSYSLKQTFYSKTYKEFHKKFTHLKKPINKYKPKNLEKFAELLEKREKFRESREVYWQLMAVFHRADFKRFSKYLKKKSKLPEELNEKFVFYLYRQTYLEYKRYTERYNALKGKNRLILRRKIKKMQEILTELEFEEEDLLDELEEDLKVFDDLEAKKVFHKHWVFRFGQSMYKGELNLQRDSDGTSNAIISSERLLNFGIAYQKENYFSLLSLGFHILTGTGSVQNDPDATITYFQDGVATAAYAFVPGYLWKFQGGAAGFGFEFPIMLQFGDFEAPTGFTFEKTTRLSFGINLLSRWMLTESLGLEFSIGKLTSQESSMWNIGGLYRF